MASTPTSAMPSLLNDAAWLHDSGATHLVTIDETNLMHKSDYSDSGKMFLGNGNALTIKHIGTSDLFSPFDHSTSLTLHNLMHVPSITKNLINVSQFA